MARPASSLLRNRNFLLLFGAYGISAFGDHLSEAGLLEVLGVRDGSEKTRISALLLFFFFLPYVVLGPLAGAAADRLPRRGIMIAADVIRALIAFGLPWYVVWIGPHHIWLMMPILALGVFAAFFNPARLSFVPDVVGDDHLTQANSLLNGLAPVAAILSFLVGGLLAGISTTLNFMGDAGTFCLSAVLVACIVLPRPQARPAPSPWIGDILSGFRYLWTHRCVWQLMVFTAAFWTASGVFRSVMTTVVFDWYGMGVEAWGVFSALLGIGMVLGSIALTVLADAPRPHHNIIVALLGVGIAMMLYASVRTPWLGAPLATGVGFFGVWIIISANTLIQRIVPNHYRGKVFGIVDLVNMTGMLLATGLLGDPFGLLHWQTLDAHVAAILRTLAAALFALGVAVWVYHARRTGYPPFISGVHAVNAVLCRFWYRLRREGPCTIPRVGPCIIAANHISTIDPNLLAAASLNRLFAFMIAREYYNTPVFKHIIYALECIPVRRDGGDIAATKEALRHLRAGKALAVFIEGRVSAPGESTVPRDGVAVLALRSSAPVIPVHLSGIHYHDGVLRTYLARHRVRIKFGKPVDLSTFSDLRDRGQIQQATHKIWQAIQALAPADGVIHLSDGRR